MRTTLVLFMICIACIKSYGQDDIVVINQTSGYKDSLVFFTADNWLVIKYNPQKYGKLQLKLPDNNYKIEFAEYSNDTFFVKLSLYGIPLGKKSFDIINEKGNMIKKVAFSLHKQPDCYVALERSLRGSSVMPRHKLSKFKGLLIFWEDKNYKESATVSSFTITINNIYNRVEQTWEIKGSLFPEEIIKLFAQLPSPTPIRFSNIIVGLPPAYCPNRRFDDISYLIK